MRIYTSRFGNKALVGMDATFVAIALGLPKWVPAYEIHGSLRELAPYRWMLTWPEDEYRLGYMAKLDSMGIKYVAELLRDIWQRHRRKPLVLLCHENVTKPGEWCHRQMFAEWWERETGECIQELELIGRGRGDAPTQMSLW